MFKKTTLALIATAFATICFNAEAVTFSDQIFNDSDWSLTTQTIDGGGSVIASQSTTGGNPGSYRRIVNSVSPGPGGVWGFHMNTGAVYDPSTQGGILSIDYFEDSIMFAGFGEGQASGAAIMQDGVYYRTPRLLSNQGSWTSQSQLSLTDLHFTSLFDSTAHPDFSAGGGLITFGFFRANSTRDNTGYQIDAGLDNWSVKINSVSAVPIPAAAWLFGTALIGLVGFSRQRKSA